MYKEKSESKESTNARQNIWKVNKMITKKKEKIAKEFEKITFMKMKDIDVRSEKELSNVLKYTKKINKR
jgi:hypothetical protein